MARWHPQYANRDRVNFFIQSAVQNGMGNSRSRSDLVASSFGCAQCSQLRRFGIAFVARNTILCVMNNLLRSAIRLAAVSCVASSLFWSTGCATSKVDWNERVGGYSMDQAILELGPPDKEAKLTDGTTVMEWLTARGYSSGSFEPIGGSRFYRGPWVFHYVNPPTPDHYLRLVFTPEGKLRSWNKVLK